MGRLNFAMVCASNQNRSMEAHALLAKEGFVVSSYGVGGHVKLPGPGPKQPNVYDFGTPYKAIYRDLMSKDPKLYERNGLLAMLQRNIKVKDAPERWQEQSNVFDVIVTFEERVMEVVVDDFRKKETNHMRSCLVVNIDVTDNHREAASAAPHALKLCRMVRICEEQDSKENRSLIVPDCFCSRVCINQRNVNFLGLKKFGDLAVHAKRNV